MKIIPISKQKRFNGKMPHGIAKILKGNELRLYIMLLEYHNSNYGYAYPTYQQIREYFGSSFQDTRIRQYIKALEEKGLIVIGKNKKNNGYDNNIYMINVPCYEDENKHLKQIIKLENRINEIDISIRTYKNSLCRLSDNKHIHYINEEIELLTNEKESLKSDLQELMEITNKTN